MEDGLLVRFERVDCPWAVIFAGLFSVGGCSEQPVTNRVLFPVRLCNMGQAVQVDQIRLR